jgi:hypothetical protein
MRSNVENSDVKFIVPQTVRLYDTGCTIIRTLFDSATIVLLNCSSKIEIVSSCNKQTKFQL